MKYREFNHKILSSILVVLFIVVTTNYLVNPFNIFEQHIFKRSLLKPEAKIQERVTKPISLKVNKDRIDAIFMGSSRTDLGIATNYYKKVTGKNAENMAMGGLRVKEIEEAIDIALKTHPEIKDIYIELNYAVFLQDENKNDFRSEITTNPNLTPEDIGIALMSFKTTTNSFWSIIKTLSGVKKRMFYSSGEKYIFKNDYINDEFRSTWNEYGSRYENSEYDPSKTKKLITYIKKLQQDGKNVYLYTFPSHVSEFYLIYSNGHQKNYENWKKEFTSVAPVYDFQYPNSITTSTITPDMDTYFDASHATYIVGNKMIDDLLNCNSENCKFARCETANNIDSINYKNYQDLKRWIRTNYELIEKINNYERGL